jgi:hypothetical protein
MLNQTKQFALVQSTLGIEAGEVERAFDQLARALPLIGCNSAPAAHAAAPRGVRVRTKAAASAEAMAAAMVPSRNAR